MRKILPDRVVCLIGRTHGEGYATIDYLEQKGKIVENIRDNLYAPVTLAILCQKYNIHFTYLGTGCIFKYEESKDNKKFTEDSLPNFFGSSYSVVKGFTDRLFHLFDDKCLNLRIRMPITSDRSSRNFISKITSYKKICSIRNSMSVLPDLLPIMVNMVRDKIVGTINFTNPGTIDHNRILELYREMVDPDFQWENFTEEEQNHVLLAERSNNELDTAKLKAYAPNVKNIEDAVIDVLKEIAYGFNKE